MRSRRLWPVALLLLMPVVAACGGDDGGLGEPGEEMSTTTVPSAPASTMSTSAPTSSAPTTAPSSASSASPSATTTPSAAPALPAACDLVSSADVRAAFGVRFDAGETDRETTTENGLSWRSDECSFEADDLVDVTVAVTGPDDFTTGTFGCPQPSERRAIVAPEPDIVGATDGWWKVSDSPPLEAELRACADDVLVVVEVDYEDGVDYDGDPRSQSVALAESVLAALGG